MLVWINGKDAAENNVDFDIDWSLRLAGDKIVSSTWIFTTTDGQLTKVSDAFISTMTKIFLSGGTVGFNYELQNQVTTQSGAAPLVENVQLLVKHR